MRSNGGRGGAVPIDCSISLVSDELRTATKGETMTATMNAGRRAALVALVALLPVDRSQGEPVRPEPTLQPVIAAPHGSSASLDAPVILSLSDNPGPGQSSGPPVYAAIAFFFLNSDGDWVAIEFVRQRSCVPASFNLLAFSDLPRAF